MEEKNDQFQERLKKLNTIHSLGYEPYGGRFDKTQNHRELVNFYAEGKSVRTAGRITALRSHGKSVFLDLRDETGRIQVYFKKEDAPLAVDSRLMDNLDLGDFIGVGGVLFKTKTGEVTLKLQELTLLSKALRPLPEKWHGLKDVETRYRRRYLDLISNEPVREIFVGRSRILTAVREFLNKKGYLEVDTPMMQPIPGGAAGKPFKTRHEALDCELYLRVAPELYLKKLLVGGFEKVYELNRCFRNEGISTRHNPEFTMLEVYTAYADADRVMDLTEELIKSTAQSVFGGLSFEFDGKKLDLSEWKRVSFAELMKKSFGILPDEKIEGWISKLKAKGVRIEGEDLSRTQLINIVSEILQPTQETHPIFVTDYFTELCPLAKKKKDNPFLSERFELFIGGMEVANGYSELNDPLEQRERLEAELRDRALEHASDRIDEDFLTALEHGMPPAGGLGIGMDRLVMLLLNQSSIREVILFPQLRPEVKTEEAASHGI